MPCRVLALACLAACSFSTGQATSTSDIDASDTPGPGATIDAPRASADAAVMIDAPPDAPWTWQVVETLTVPCVNQAVVSTIVLSSSRMWRLHVSGTCTVNTSNGSLSDAEYFGWNVGPTYDTYGNVDNGIAIDDLTIGSSKQPQWGSFASDHVYEVDWTGADATIGASYHDSNDTNNSGSLTLEILEYR